MLYVNLYSLLLLYYATWDGHLTKEVTFIVVFAILLALNIISMLLFFTRYLNQNNYLLSLHLFAFLHNLHLRFHSIY